MPRSAPASGPQRRNRESLIFDPVVRPKSSPPPRQIVALRRLPPPPFLHQSQVPLPPHFLPLLCPSVSRATGNSGSRAEQYPIVARSPAILPFTRQPGSSAAPATQAGPHTDSRTKLPVSGSPRFPVLFAGTLSLLSRFSVHSLRRLDRWLPRANRSWPATASPSRELLHVSGCHRNAPGAGHRGKRVYWCLGLARTDRQRLSARGL